MNTKKDANEPMDDHACHDPHCGHDHGHAHDMGPAHNPARSIGRNDPCPCGSAKKFKKCCLKEAV